MNNSPGTPRIGLALGSGAARGWSHIGVLKALLRAGIEPDIVCGTSVGAMIGGAYVAGNLDKLERWVLGSTRTDVLSFFSIRMPQTAFVDHDRLNWFLHNFVAAAEITIESRPKAYAAVCTNLENGHEIWLREGSLADAVRASMAMPGLFPAVRKSGQWLVDGGLVNPVPVTACRALGAEFVIGVNLNADILSRRNLQKHNHQKPVAAASSSNSVFGSLKQQAKEVSSSLFADDDKPDKAPGLFYAISKSINIFQDQITRGRLAGDPADVVIEPKVGDIGMLDFQRAAAAIEEGDARLMDAIVEIRKSVGAE